MSDDGALVEPGGDVVVAVGGRRRRSRSSRSRSPARAGCRSWSSPDRPAASGSKWLRCLPCSAVRVARVLGPRRDGGATGRTPAIRRTGRSCGARRCSGRTARSGSRRGPGSTAGAATGPGVKVMPCVDEQARARGAGGAGRPCACRRSGRPARWAASSATRCRVGSSSASARRWDPAPATSTPAAGWRRTGAGATRSPAVTVRGQAEESAGGAVRTQPSVAEDEWTASSCSSRPARGICACSSCGDDLSTCVGCDVDPGVPLRYLTDEGVKQQCQEPTALPPTRPRPSARARSSASTPSVASSWPAAWCWRW